MVCLRRRIYDMIGGLVIRVLSIWTLFGGGILLAMAGYVVVGFSLHACLVTYLLFGTLHPSTRLFGPVQTHCEDGIWLTFDDGPDPKTTPAILDLLDQSNANATFFVIGQKAAAHPELIREIHRRGHQIGNHTWSHPRGTFWCHGPIRTYREIARCQETLTSILGESPKVFRAPVGHYNVFVHPVLRHLNLRLISWSSRGFDGVSSPVGDVMERIKRTLSPGGIVLAHEATPIATDVTTGILTLIAKNGWTVAIPDASPKSDNC
jgi:peptidoglycan/xylan/chitin deacetylase (PgdA/CDA1 family)